MKLVIKRQRFESRRKSYLFSLMIILMLSHKFFYMWLQDDYMMGSLKYSDISVILSVLFTGLVLLQYGWPRENRIKWFVYAYAALTVISALTAYMIYDQSIIRGIFAQRCQLSYLILFLGVERLFEKHVISKNDVVRIIYLMCWIELFLCTIQYVYYLISGNLFLTVGAGSRYESARLYFDPGILLLVVFKSFSDLLSTKRKRIRNFVFIVWTAMFLMVITQMRAMTLAFLVALVVGLVIWKSEWLKKILVAIIAIFVGTKILSRYAIIQDLIKVLTDLNSDANYNVRNLGRAEFISEFAKSPITGRGYPSISSSAAYNTLQGYLFVDNGIFGLIYSYGILGLIWWVALWVTVMLKAWRVRKRQMAYFLYFVYYLVGLVTDFAWFWTATCSFSILVAMLLEEERELKDEAVNYNA